jgi:hypothetical protein
VIEILLLELSISMISYLQGELIPNLKIDATDQPIRPHPQSLSQRARDFEFGSLLPREKGWG